MNVHKNTPKNGENTLKAGKRTPSAKRPSPLMRTALAAAVVAALCAPLLAGAEPVVIETEVECGESGSPDLSAVDELVIRPSGGVAVVTGGYLQAELLHAEGALSAAAGGAAYVTALRSDGARLTVSGGTADTGESVMLVKMLEAASGDTRVTLDGTAGLAGTGASLNGAAQLVAGSVSAATGATLTVSVGKNARFVLGDPDVNADELPDAHAELRAGAVIRTQTAAEIGRGVFLAAGGSESERAAAAGVWNLWVGEGGVLTTEGSGVTLALADGTAARFESGSTLWIESAPGSSADRFAVTGLDLSKAAVSGLGNVDVRVGEDLRHGALVRLPDGSLEAQMSAPEFSGPFASALADLYGRRLEASTPGLYRELFTHGAATAARTTELIAAAATLTGSDERLLTSAARRSLDVRSAVAAAERRRDMTEAAGAEADGDAGDAFGAMMPEALRNLPLVAGVSQGRSRVKSASAFGAAAETETDDTTAELALVLGSGDWRFGIAGSFTTRDPRGNSGAPLALTTESEETGVTLFASRPLSGGRVTADLTWLESSDDCRMSAVNERLTATGVRRSTWSAGVLYERELSRAGAWRLEGLAGLRALAADGVDTTWRAAGGDVMRVREDETFRLIGTAGASLAGRTELEPASGVLADWKPRGLDLSLTLAAHAVGGSGRAVSASVPGAAARTRLPDADAPERLRLSAGVAVGADWRDLRLEAAIGADRAGSDVRSAAASARAVWVLNAL